MFLKNKEIWRIDFIIFLLISALYYMNNYMLNPILTGYSAELGGSGQLIGLISGAMSAVALFFTPVSGPLADRINRRKLAIFSFSLLILANVGYVLAANAWILLAARIIQGFGFSFSSIILSTIISTMFESKHVGKAISIYALIQALGQAVGPSLGLVVRDACGYRTTFAVALGLTLACLVLLVAVKDFGACPKNLPPFHLSLENIVVVPLLPVAVICLVCGILIHALQSYLDPFAVLVGHTAGVNIFFTVYAGALLVSRALLTGAMDRYSIGQFVLGCVPLTAAGLLLLQNQTGPVMLLGGAVLCAVGIGSLQTMSQVFLVKHVGLEQRGVANSTYYIGMNLGHTIGGYVGGLLIKGMFAKQFFYFFLPVALLPLLCALLFRGLYFSKRRTH